MRRLRPELQLGQRPTNSTGQLGAGDGAGQWPAVPQLGQNHLAVLQQLQTVVVMAFIGVWCWLAPGWGAPAAGLSTPEHPGEHPGEHPWCARQFPSAAVVLIG